MSIKVTPAIEIEYVALSGRVPKEDAEWFAKYSERMGGKRGATHVLTQIIQQLRAQEKRKENAAPRTKKGGKKLGAVA